MTDKQRWYNLEVDLFVYINNLANIIFLFFNLFKCVHTLKRKKMQSIMKKFIII